MHSIFLSLYSSLIQYIPSAASSPSSSPSSTLLPLYPRSLPLHFSLEKSRPSHDINQTQPNKTQ